VAERQGRSAEALKAIIFGVDGVLTDSEPLNNAAAVAMFGERASAVGC
jgi:beta-phosphoglucomutase-like phosphatase (HAD superfamily)